MKVLVVGGGGREHALAWKLCQSPRVSTVYLAPGNGGTALEPGCHNTGIAADDTGAILDWALAHRPELTVVGPEAPLVAGLVDTFQSHGLRCFGPSRAASRLEGSKAFAKAFMARHRIPSARYDVFRDPQPALGRIRSGNLPMVIKVDGLAAGKGVTIARTREEGERAIDACFSLRLFGDAGSQVVIEDYLEGEEASFICIVGGGRFLSLATSQDHKPRDDGDRGPNTGGMGAYSPAPVVTPELHRRILQEIVAPTILGLADEGVDYTGFLYAGLMVSRCGAPSVLEFNCRLGDPETQPIMMRLRSDLTDLCDAALDGHLEGIEIDWDPRPALGVVMAAGGYPGNYQSGYRIDGLDRPADPDVKVFHAGTALHGDDLVTSGGRVLCVTALGDTVVNAQTRAYQTVRAIRWRDCQYRTDIGYRAVARESAGTTGP